jgi:hypothetical protein
MITKFDDFLNEDEVYLKTMTLKSIINFGKFKNHTVQRIIDLNKGYYLKQMYLNHKDLTFTDDVLKLIGITDKTKIKKPGTIKKPLINSY